MLWKNGESTYHNIIIITISGGLLKVPISQYVLWKDDPQVTLFSLFSIAENSEK